MVTQICLATALICLKIWVTERALKSISHPEIPDLDREWSIGKSIPNQISQIIVYGNYLCQVKLEHKKMDLQ